MSIFVSGSLAYDIILDYPGKFADHIKRDKVHVLSLSFLVREVKKSVGGTAGNIAYNLEMLGLPVQLVACVGRDGGSIVEKLSRPRVKFNYLKISQLPTATAYIMTDSADSQIAGFYPGAMMEPRKLPKVRAGDWAVIAAENPANMARLAKHYQRNKVRYIFDPGQAITALSKAQMRDCARAAAIVIGNDYEISTVKTRLPKNARPSIFWQSVVIKTMGVKGSEIIYPNGQNVKIGIATVKKAVDPTGAGDAYRAGLLFGIVEGLDLKRSCRLGATAASFAVEKYGTQNHKFTFKSLLARHNTNFADKI